MTFDRRNLITSAQLMVFIISAKTGTGIISLPYLLAKKAGHDGWISEVIAGITIIIMAAFIIKLLEMHGNKSIFEINNLLYGKYAGGALNIFYLIYITFKAAINLRITIEVIHIIILRVTPPLLLTVLILLPTAYASWYGWRVVCRYSNLIFATIFAVLVLYAVTAKYVRLTFLLPVGNIGLTGILESMEPLAFSFLGFAFVWILYPMVTDKEKTMKYTIWGLTICTLFYIVTVVMVTGFFGENMLHHILFPVYYLALSYKAPIFERIDLLFLVLWMPAFGMVVRAYFFSAYYWIFNLFIEKKSAANKVRTISLILFSSVVVFLSRIPKDYNQLLKYIEFMDIVGVPLTYGMAIIGYIITLIKGTKTNA